MPPRQSSQARPAPAHAPGTIGFRLDERTFGALAKRADRLGISPHHLARELVFASLQEPDQRAALRDHLAVIHDQLLSLREDIATTTEALLMSAGKVEAKEAHDWVERTFK